MTTPCHLSRLAEVAIPTLVIIGDSDVLTIPHAAAIRDGLADAQLAVEGHDARRADGEAGSGQLPDP